MWLYMDLKTVILWWLLCFHNITMVLLASHGHGNWDLVSLDTVVSAPTAALFSSSVLFFPFNFSSHLLLRFPNNQSLLPYSLLFLLSWFVQENIQSAGRYGNILRFYILESGHVWSCFLIYLHFIMYVQAAGFCNSGFLSVMLFSLGSMTFFLLI